MPRRPGHVVGHVVGVDRSVEVVAQAAEAHGAGNVSYSVADVCRLEHPDDAFYVVHAHQCSSTSPISCVP